MCNLVISNDTPPIQGSVTFVRLLAQAAAAFPTDSKSTDNSVTIEFKDAKISNHGTLIGENGKNLIEITYFGEGKLKIQG